jgi:sigma-E factor negative regulatory protein RseC
LTTEKGTVTKVGVGTAWVKATRSGACGNCASRDVCHTLGGGGHETEVEAINVCGAREGDRVVISFKTASLLKASFLLYVFPVFGLIAGALLGQTAAPVLGFDSSGFSAICGMAFLAFSFLFVRQKGNRMGMQDNYRPRIIKILPQEVLTPDVPENAHG